MSKRMSPNQRETLSAQSTISGNQEYLTSTSGALNVSATISPNSSVNVAQIAGTATSVGNGATDTGTQRVTISNDSTGQVKLATGANVVGAVTQSGAWTDTVTQTTASNLNAQVVGALASGASNAGNPVKVGAVYNSADLSLSTGQVADLQMNNQGKLKIIINDTVGTQTTDLSGSTGLASLNSTTNQNVTGRGSASINISGSWSGTITFQGSNDGTTFFTLAGLDQSDGSTDTTTTANGTWIFNVSGLNVIQAQMTAYSSGTATVKIRVGAGSSGGILKVDPTGTTTQPVNMSQIVGNAVSTGVGATGTGVQRIVQANGAGRTLVSAGGSASSSGNNTLVAAGTNRLKVYAFSLTTTSTSSTTCIFQSGASGTELWRVVLQAPTGTSVGANLSVEVPSYLFATASATLLNLNLSGANTVHWSVAYFDEA